MAWDEAHWQMVSRTIGAVLEQVGGQLTGSAGNTFALTDDQTGTILHGCREAGWQHDDIQRFVRALIPPGPLPPIFPGARGAIRLIGTRAVGDDEGPHLYLGLSRFYWLWAWKHDRDRVLREMDQDRAAGYRYARVFLQVQNLGSDHYWDGREVDPTWPDHQVFVAALCEAARERGLALLLTLIGKGGRMERQDISRAYVGRMAHVLRDYSDMVLCAEMMNEPGMRGEITGEEIRELEQVFRAEAPALLTATGACWTEQSATGWSNVAWETTQGQVGICHLDRSNLGPPEGRDRAWRQPWDIGLYGKRWVDNEPIGPAASVMSEERPAVLRSHRAVAFMSRAFGTCFHSDAGIRGFGDVSQAPGYAECPRAVRFLPGDLPNGQQQNARDVYPTRHWDLPIAYVRSESGRGVVRAYGVRIGTTQYTIPFGIVSRFKMQAVWNLHVRCYQQDVNDLLWERDVQAGERVDFFDDGLPDFLLVSCE